MTAGGVAMYWKSGEYPWYVLVPATICETTPWAATWEAKVAKAAAVVKDFILTRDLVGTGLPETQNECDDQKRIERG